jgi:hypothetical protein
VNRLSLIDRRLVGPVTAIAALAAVALPLLAYFFWYGGNATWPGLITNFSATFGAFLIALAWDRRERQVEAERQASAAHGARVTEARRRLAAVEVELRRLEASIKSVLADQPQADYFLPDLHRGSWEAAREGLGVVLAHYKLLADLATFYGRVDDLQWRLRFQAEAWTVNRTEGERFKPMVTAIAHEALSDVERLLPEVQQQIRTPDVQQFGLAHYGSATLTAKVAALASLTAEPILTPRGDAARDDFTHGERI